MPPTLSIPARRSSATTNNYDQSRKRFSLMPQPLKVTKRPRRISLRKSSLHRYISSSSIEELLLSPPSTTLITIETPTYISPPESSPTTTNSSLPHPLLNKSLPALPTTSVCYPTPPSSPRAPPPPSLSSSASISPTTTAPTSPKQGIPSSHDVPTHSCYSCTKLIPSTSEIFSFPLTAPAARSAVYHIFNRQRGRLSMSWLPEKNMMFCHDCFAILHKMQMCWGCGEECVREQERVKCGWAWWHYSCIFCLLCRVPITPPKWTGQQNTLDRSPVCGRCEREVGDMVERESRTVRSAAPSPSPHASTSSSPHGRKLSEQQIDKMAQSGEIARASSGYDGSCELEEEGIMGEYKQLLEEMKVARESVGDERLEEKAIRRIVERCSAKRFGKGYVPCGRNGDRKVGGGVGGGRRVSCGRIEKGRVGSAGKLGGNGGGNVGGKAENGGGAAITFPGMPKWMEKLPGNVKRAQLGGWDGAGCA